jgi:hypothetical protein
LVPSLLRAGAQLYATFCMVTSLVAAAAEIQVPSPVLTFTQARPLEISPGAPLARKPKYRLPLLSAVIGVLIWMLLLYAGALLL